MESFFPPLEALFDKRAKHPVLLVNAVEESANVTLPAEIASGELYGMTLVCHISPHMHSRYETESRIANALTTTAPFTAGHLSDRPFLRTAPVNAAASLDSTISLAFPRGSDSGILAAFGIGAVALAPVLILVSVIAHVRLRCARVGIVEASIRSSVLLRQRGKCRERS